MPATAAAAPVGHAFRSVLLAGNERLPPSVPPRLPPPLSPIHPALFVYNLNVVFVCCLSLLPAKKSLSLSLSFSHPHRTKALRALPPTPPPFQTKRQIFPPNAISHSMDGHLFFLAGRCDAPTSNFGEKQPNQGRIGFFLADVCGDIQVPGVTCLTGIMTI